MCGETEVFTMNHVTAACGCSVVAIGAPGSPARERAELEPCIACAGQAAYDRFLTIREYLALNRQHPSPAAAIEGKTGADYVQELFDAGRVEAAARIVNAFADWRDSLPGAIHAKR